MENSEIQLTLEHQSKAQFYGEGLKNCLPGRCADQVRRNQILTLINHAAFNNRTLRMIYFKNLKFFAGDVGI